MFQIKETYLSKVKYPQSIFITLSTLLFSLLFSSIYWFDHAGLSSSLAANKILVFDQGEYQRLFSSVLIHSDLDHFLSNSFMFTILGILIHRYFGSLLFPLLSYFMSVLSHSVSLWTFGNENVYLVGASGWVFLLGGCWLTLYICIERRDRLFIRIFKAIAVGLILFSPQTFVPHVSYRTHAIGFFFGIILSIFVYLLHKSKYDQYEVYEEIIEPEDEEVTEYFE